MVDDTLATLLASAVDGRPPPSDGSVTVLPQPPGPVAGILAFAAHHVVAADVDEAWVRARLRPGDLSAPLGATFVGALTERLGVAPDNLDLVLAGRGTGQGTDAGFIQPAPADLDHPRAARSRAYRTEGRAFTTLDGAGLLLVARGLAGRWEAAFEVDEAARGRGLGRALAAAALGLVPAGEPLFVAVAPGNVPSLRAVLAADGYRPVGAELLFAVGADPFAE